MQFTNIDNFINWVQVQKRFSKKVSLDKMKYYCQLFDNPQDQLNPFMLQVRMEKVVPLQC